MLPSDAIPEDPEYGFRRALDRSDPYVDGRRKRRRLKDSIENRSAAPNKVMRSRPQHTGQGDRDQLTADDDEPISNAD